ncbi:MAG: glutamine amidotransferase [Betaproteobacteria bacterium RIFCSPLOWO2_12_FULL_62_13]|nr:MAG: glutamine amidotransferase [Betaproteobacteria bacterium RIFCSPLOWO2_12_FULL_62_13]
MKPIAIFRHVPAEGPGYFATYLSRRGIPWRLVKIDEGEPVPGDPRAFSGMAFMGGPMSVNDGLPWIPPVLALINAAVGADVPLVGHCLGGQLMARAMGGSVTRNPVKEIGWGRVDVLGNTEAERWFGASLESFDSFHWHGESFSIPPGAVRVASSPYCENQMFVLGKHLGMQCHVEMTPELIRTWCDDWKKEVQSLAARMPSVQTPAEMTDAVEDKVRALNAVADRLYDRWTAGLK